MSDEMDHGELYAALLFRCEQAERERDELQQLVGIVHPRVFKLASKGGFICIGEHEPYFMECYAMIREHEMAQGTWTEDDRVAYMAAQMRIDSDAHGWMELDDGGDDE